MEASQSPVRTQVSRERRTSKAKLSAAVYIAFVAIDAVLTIWASLWFGFTFDDLMNGYWGLTRSWTALILDTAKIWRVSPVYRPVGVAALKGFYQLSGLNITAWRLFYGVLFCAALLMFFLFARRLTRSWLAASAGSLLLAYHPNLRWVYFNMGYVYDLLACIFSFAYALLYLRYQKSGRLGVAIAALCCLWLGLESKESAVAAFVFVVVHEFLFDPPWKCYWIRWLGSKKLACVSLVLVGIYSASRLWDPSSAVEIENYRLTVTLLEYVKHLTAWLQELTVFSFFGTFVGVVAALLALWQSRRLTLWCVLSFLGGVLPSAFIPQRGLETTFVAVCALAVMFGLACDSLIAKVSMAPTQRLRSLRFHVQSAVAFVIFAFILMIQGGPSSRVVGFPFYAGGGLIMPALHALQFFPAPEGHERIVIESDPFRQHEWASLFLFALFFDEPDLVVRRKSNPPPGGQVAFDAPDWRRVTWDGLQWRDLPRFRTGGAAGARSEPGRQ